MNFQLVKKQIKLMVSYLYLKSNFLLANIINSTAVKEKGILKRISSPTHMKAIPLLIIYVYSRNCGTF